MTGRDGNRGFAITYDANAWLRMLMELGVAAAIATEWAPAFASEIQPDRFSAGMFDVRACVTQYLHESAMLRKLEEDLSYSAERISVVWNHRYPTPESAKHLEHNPRALANAVYGGRGGNTQPDDGYNFRGRPALTFRANYEWLGNKWGQDLTTDPGLLLMPHFALDGWFFWWEGHLPDSTLSDQVKVRKIVQGGDEGLPHCQALFDLCKRVMA